MSSETVRTCWTSLENLRLDMPCYAPPLQQVNSFLGRFSSLLRGIGCRSIHYPQVASLNLTSTAGKRIQLATLLQKQQAQGCYTDVTFKAKDGVPIHAHKAVLVGESEYCVARFNGEWAPLAGAKDDQVIEIDDITSEALEILVKYCYFDSFDWASPYRVVLSTETENGLNSQEYVDTLANKLDFLIEVLVGADRWMMAGLKKQAEDEILQGARFFVRPDNVAGVKKAAEDYRAQRLEDYCSEFENRNREPVILANRPMATPQSAGENADVEWLEQQRAV